MTNSTSEREQRLKQIGERSESRKRVAGKFQWAQVSTQEWTDIDFLLSLLASETAGDDDDARLDAMLRKAGIQHTCHRPHDASTALERLVRNISDLASTSMRDLCVEKVEALRERWANNQQTFGANNAHAHIKWGTMVGAATDIITDLQSLTLDNQQPAKRESCCISALLHSGEKKRK